MRTCLVAMAKDGNTLRPRVSTYGAEARGSGFSSINTEVEGIGCPPDGHIQSSK